MALTYLPVDRDQQFLLPPSMRDWLPEEHLAWFVLEVVQRVDTCALHARHPNDGVGRRAYDPDMLLALLIYAYCMGVRSSRQIERLCLVDVAFRVIVAGHQPDHTTIARFRQGHQEVAQSLFVDVLELCAASGLVKLGVVAIDGTKVAADASMKANRSRESLEAEVRCLFDQAEDADEHEDTLFGDARGDELPPELRGRRSRRARLDAALAVLEAQRKEREARQAAEEAARVEAARAGAGRRGRRPSRVPASHDLAEAEQTLAAEQANSAERAKRWEQRQQEAAAEGRRPRGRPPKLDDNNRLQRARQRVERARARAEQRSKAQPPSGRERANTTDPDSRLMKGPHGWLQGYNAQAAVSEGGVVLAAQVTQEHNDVGQCQPMMCSTEENLRAAGLAEPLGVAVLDAGYLSTANLTAKGPERLIATGKSWKMRSAEPTSGPPPEDADPIEAMQHRLRTPEGSAAYAKRQHMVEPVFGEAKHLRNFRRFSQRGLTAVETEWKLVMASHNVLKLFRHQARAAT